MANNNYYQSKPKSAYPRNEEIRAREVFVIDEAGEKLGVMSTQTAIDIARERELDLVEVAPNVTPPVAKILSWNKLKYQLSKKEKEAKKHKIEMKEMWFKSFIDDGDLNHKLKKVKEFLQKKNPVKITIKARRRVSKDQLDSLLSKILEHLQDHIEYDEKPKFEGHNLVLIVRPAKATKKVAENEKQNENTQS